MLKILAVELEPAPYKIDLWNSFSDKENFDVYVLYTEKKNWAPDAGHNYQKFPYQKFPFLVCKGGSFWEVMKSVCIAVKKCRSFSPDLIYVAGYTHIPTISCLLYATLMRKQYVVHADIFNTKLPPGSWVLVKLIIRKILRWIIFKYAKAVLVCGNQGVKSALLAGCSIGKIINFPYAVSLSRILDDNPKALPLVCMGDLGSQKLIIFFSGRMIPRKGLATLINALVGIRGDYKWVLWIEGDGPDYESYVDLTKSLGLINQCRFLGFCQYDLHSWLIRSSHIVVVPSIEDTWGIVVDEGMQLGKVVISTNATGSAIDRIQNGVNGYIFQAGNVDQLRQILITLIIDSELRLNISNAAKNSNRFISPDQNVLSLINFMDK